MKLMTTAVFFSLALLAGCAAPTTLKSPCAGAQGSPCDRTPLIGAPIGVMA